MEKNRNMETKQNTEMNRNTNNRNGEKLNDEQLEQINGGIRCGFPRHSRR